MKKTLKASEKAMIVYKKALSWCKKIFEWKCDKTYLKIQLMNYKNILVIDGSGLIGSSIVNFFRKE